MIVACYQRAYVRGVKRQIGDLVAALRKAVEERSGAASIYPGIQNLVLAARAHGLAATMTTWHLFAEADVEGILGFRTAPEHTRSFRSDGHSAVLVRYAAPAR